MWRLFGSGSADEAKAEPKRSIPASWYRSPNMYELERRAIFSRKWILLTHSIRLREAGDFISFTYAGFPFFLIRDREGKVNGFHNVCRHRAYPVVQTTSGTTKVLSCKYHGWSYGFKGNLAKAPRFDTVEGFDKTQHGLLPIHVHIDKVGFVWVNLQAGEPDIKWEDEFSGADEKPILREFNFDDEFKFDHVWDMELESNWKGVIENYNECYHCPTSHPLIAGVSDLTKYKVEPARGCLEHTIINKNMEDNSFRRSITFFPPCTSVTVTEHFFYIQRMIPVSATSTRIENEVYRHKDSTDEKFNDLCEFYKQVLEEDKDLCVRAQENLNSGVFVNGQLHPEKENGPLHFQEQIKREVMAHRKKEEEAGGVEIWPARQRVVGDMRTGKLSEEEAFCSKLDQESCLSNQGLAW
ncbi:Rieske [2Fe-2S] iron-sulfur domain-containing protein [Xylariales sp. PMI_506]|nr:Rieske [2Fe-2S] iron-sulfur domain-containing protein [Xylariales sp. PMI_506]